MQLDYTNFDLTPLLDNGQADPNQSIKVIYVSGTITEFHIISDVSSYLPDLDNEDWNKANQKENSVVYEEEIHEKSSSKSASIIEAKISEEVNPTAKKEEIQEIVSLSKSSFVTKISETESIDENESFERAEEDILETQSTCIPTDSRFPSIAAVVQHLLPSHPNLHLT